MEIDITSCERYIRHLANNYRNFGDIEDMVQEGYIGVMIAEKNYDPKNGASFLTYASKYIKSRMYEYWFKNFNVLKLDNNKINKKIITKIYSYKLVDDDNNIDFERVKIVSEKYNIPIEKILDVINYINAPKSLIQHSENGEEFYITDLEINDTDTFTEELDKYQKYDKLFSTMRELLGELEYEIIFGKWFMDYTYKQLGEKFNFSGSRIEQIEKNAIKKLKTHLTNLNGDI